MKKTHDTPRQHLAAVKPVKQRQIHYIYIYIEDRKSKKHD